MNKIRIIQTCTIPLTFWFFARNQLRFLNQIGFDVTAVCSPGAMFNECSDREGVDFLPVKMSREIDPIRDLWAIIKMVQLVRKIRPDILQGSTPKAAFLTMIAGKINRVPVCIFLMRGLRYQGLKGWRKRVVKIMESVTCNLADQILSTSTGTMLTAINDGLCSGGKIKVVNKGTANGIDSELFSPDRFSIEKKDHVRKQFGIRKSDTAIVFVGRLVREKGLIELYKAWQIIRSKYSGVHLFLVGPQEKHDHLPNNIIRGFSKDLKVHMIGYVPDPAIFYAISSFALLPSYREGIGYTPLEAASMGIPSIASDIPGCNSAVIHGKTGLLVPSGDFHSLAYAMGFYLSNPNMAKKHGNDARERVLKDFKPEVIWLFYVQEYLRLLKKRRVFSSSKDKM